MPPPVLPARTAVANETARAGHTRPQRSCLICGGDRFLPGPLGRMSRNGLEPQCADCGSLERHRILRRVYLALPKELLSRSSALQFSCDPAAPAERFARFEIARYEPPDGLDIAAIDRPSASCDWIIANHVLEHVEDDLGAVAEMLRVVTRRGVIQLMVPSPSSAWETEAIHGEDEMGHRRRYGSDFPVHIAPALADALGIAVTARDAVTGRWDAVYFFSRSPQTLKTLALALIAADIPALRCA